MKQHSQYLEEIFDPQLIVNAFEFLVPTSLAKRKSVVYIGTGLSGTAPLFILKQAGLIDRIGIVRKESEDSHGCVKVEMSHEVEPWDVPWIFIDDMIDTGKTFKRVLARMNPDKFHGCLLYHCQARWKTPARLLERYGYKS